jgi:hypothetical protein
VLEHSCFSDSGVERVAFGSELKRIEEFCFYETSLKNVSIPSQVDFIGESAVAVNTLGLVEVSGVNAQFTICEHALVDERSAIAL